MRKLSFSLDFFELNQYCPSLVGAWRSLVAHLHGVQGVVGSNPVAPTNFLISPP